ncbi:hypothetical protein KIW84_063079 [Lathyrus oleraceus]|nr:hypothetical protein KIW84_063079 [Pisum sativum]
MVESNDTIAAVTLDEEPIRHCMSNNIREYIMTDTALSMQEYVNSGELQTSSSPNTDINMICEKPGASDCLTVVDIDKELKDSQVWSDYAPDTYFKASEVKTVALAMKELHLNTERLFLPAIGLLLVHFLI